MDNTESKQADVAKIEIGDVWWDKENKLTNGGYGQTVYLVLSVDAGRSLDTDESQWVYTTVEFTWMIDGYKGAPPPSYFLESELRVMELVGNIKSIKPF